MDAGLPTYLLRTGRPGAFPSVFIFDSDSTLLLLLYVLHDEMDAVLAALFYIQLWEGIEYEWSLIPNKKAVSASMRPKY